MRQTLFTIDHYLFAEHWILFGWIALGLLLIGWQLWVGRKQDAIGILPVLLIGAAIIYFVLPKVETPGVDPANPNGPLVPLGLAIRGYGFFMLLAIASGFGLALLRCRQTGYDGEKIIGLGFWMIIAGIVGARLFYVIQKFENFTDLSGRELLFKLVDMTSGGLVVYGSLFGGIIAAVIYMWLHRMPWRRVADIMAPGMAIGLAVGRIGCLMNGCCYGGACDDRSPGLVFPAASPPYVHQLYNGQLLGINGSYDESTGIVAVESVTPDGLGDKYGIRAGDEIQIRLAHEQRDDPQIRLRAAKAGADIAVAAIIVGGSQGPVSIPVSQLPDQSLRTHPTQVYSAINAALLCALLWFWYPFRRSDGEVFALMLVLYPVGRFMLEIIRRDELGLMGSSLTISQWVSIGAFVFGVGLMAYVRTTAPGRMVPGNRTAGQ